MAAVECMFTDHVANALYKHYLIKEPNNEIKLNVQPFTGQ